MTKLVTTKNSVLMIKPRRKNSRPSRKNDTLRSQRLHILEALLDICLTLEKSQHGLSAQRACGDVANRIRDLMADERQSADDRAK